MKSALQQQVLAGPEEHNSTPNDLGAIMRLGLKAQVLPEAPQIPLRRYPSPGTCHICLVLDGL